MRPGELSGLLRISCRSKLEILIHTISCLLLDLIIQDISLYMVLNKFQLLKLLAPTRIQGSDFFFLWNYFAIF
jgi:hypothetical protein